MTSYTDEEIDSWEDEFVWIEDQDDGADDPIGCECEIDWNCGHCGGTSRPTWIETRYQGTDDEPF